MFVPDIADAERMSEVITAHADELGLAPRVGPCRLLDARIRHSHRPSSPRCQGWATYSVPTNGEPAALLYVRGYPASAQPWGELVAAGRAGGAIHLPEYDLIVWKFPEDPSLPALPQLVDPTRIVGLLPTGRVMPDRLHVDVVRYQPDPGARGRRNFDVAGATTVTGGLLLLVYGLNRGAEDGWTSITTLLLFAAAALLLAMRSCGSRRGRAPPLVPASAVRNRTLVAANLSAFFAFGAFFSFIFLATLLMQQVLGYSPTKTGVAWLSTSVTAFIASAAAGARLVALVGVRKLLVTGLSLLAISMLWLTRVPTGADYVADLLPAFLLAGVAIGLCAPSVQIGALSGVSESTSGLASGLVETMREIGGAAGVAAVSTMLVSRTGLDGYRAAFVVISIAAALGAVTAGIGFPRRPETSGEEELVRAAAAGEEDLAPLRIPVEASN